MSLEGFITETPGESKKGSGEKRPSHAYGSVSVAFHCHRLISHSLGIQLFLSHSSSPPYSFGGGAFKGVLLCLAFS